MIPLFFPFTHVSDPTLDALSALFRKVGLYRPSDDPLPEPMQRSVEAGFLEIRIPVQGDDGRLAAAVAEYEAWAGRHGSSPLAYFKSQRETIPFFEESSLSRIRSEIKRWRSAEPVEDPGDPVFAARLFLAVAQAFDRQRWEVDHGFADLRDLETSLLKSIHGDAGAGEAAAIRPPMEDLGRHLPDRRLWAWACLRSRDPGASTLLVTDSREIFDTTLEPLFESQPVERIDIPWSSAPPDPDRQAELHRFLTELSEGSGNSSAVPPPAKPGKGEGGMVLRLFRAGGIDPQTVLFRAAGIGKEPDRTGDDGNVPGATLVGYLDLSG